MMTEETPTPWYKKRWVIVVGVLIAISVIANIGDTTEEAVPVAAAESTTTTTTVAPTTTRPTPRTTQPATSGDWVSERAYLEDVVDTADKLSSLFGAVSDVSYGLADGEFTFDQGVILMTSAQTALRTHIDHFAGTTAPAGHGTTHSLFLRAMDTYDRAFGLFIRGLEGYDVDLIEQAISVMAEGNSLLDQATESMAP